MRSQPSITEPSVSEHPITEAPQLLSVDEEFAAFYRREHEGQVRRAFLMVGSAATAHDVVSDAFTAVFRRWDSIAEPGGYLNRCVLNGCRDVHRRRKRNETLTADPEVGGVTDPVDEMAEILLTLPFRQRAAIVMRFYGGLSEKEIAEALKCRPGTVASSIHRGLAALRTSMQADPEGGWS